MKEKIMERLNDARTRLGEIQTSTKVCAALATLPVLAAPVFAEGETGSTTSAQLSSIVTSNMIGGVLDEIIGLLPTILPVMIGFIALRKGISFVLNMLHSA